MNTWSSVRSLQRIHRSPVQVSPRSMQAEISRIWVSLSTGGTTCGTNLPTTSSRVQPYIRVAALFQNRIRPWRSVPMMACPAASSRSAWNRIESSAARRAVTSRWLMTMPSTAGSSRWLVMLNSSQQSSPDDRAHPDIGVERLAGLREHLGQHVVHGLAVGGVEKAERDPPIAVDELGCGGGRRVRLEDHAVRVDDVVALDGVGEHQLVAVLSGRRGALGRHPVGDVANRRHHGVRPVVAACARSGRASISIHFNGLTRHTHAEHLADRRLAGLDAPTARPVLDGDGDPMLVDDVPRDSRGALSRQVSSGRRRGSWRRHC